MAVVRRREEYGLTCEGLLDGRRDRNGWNLVASRSVKENKPPAAAMLVVMGAQWIRGGANFVGVPTAETFG